MNNQTIHDRIKIARLQLGMTMEELAHKVGYVGRSTVGLVEQGKRSISHDMLVKYAEALKVSPHWLLYGFGDGLKDVTELKTFNPALMSCDKLGTLGKDFNVNATTPDTYGGKIKENDIVTVKRFSKAENGDVVAVVIDDHFSFRYWHHMSDEHLLILIPLNPSQKPLTFPEEQIGDKVKYIGKAAYVLNVL